MVGEEPAAEVDFPMGVLLVVDLKADVAIWSVDDRSQLLHLAVK